MRARRQRGVAPVHILQPGNLYCGNFTSRASTSTSPWGPRPTGPRL